MVEEGLLFALKCSGLHLILAFASIDFDLSLQTAMSDQQTLAFIKS